MKDESAELPPRYDPAAHQEPIYRRWLESEAFSAVPDRRRRPYVVMMPLPNVTGALHMGHAMDNVMQDLLVRRHRMQGDNTLWQPGTDHAGIATQAVVEKRLYELEGITRHDLGREELVRRIWAWKDQYERRIIEQQQAMGCSCDWDRQRFTMDAVCRRAVRETFFRLFNDGLIYRGDRLVNWDCHLQTAVSDDEIYHERVQGRFWHLRYPVVDPGPGEPRAVVVATVRPETMLGDTAVACHPDPAAALDELESSLKARLEKAPARERPQLEEQLAEVDSRRSTHLPGLLQLADMARSGRCVRLPLQERDIPLILDTWARPELGSGCVKITPAHDPNDYEVWLRHKERIGAVNLLNPDGTFNEAAGSYAGLERFEVRKRVVADLEALGLVEAVEDRELEVGHSDRSKTPVEPYLSRQWFVRMGDVEGGVTMGGGTELEFRSPGLAQAAIDAVRGPWRSGTGLKLRFHPDHERYAGTYCDWLAEKRDWCISRQLWWGHRIPVWKGTFESGGLGRAAEAVARIPAYSCRAWVVAPSGETMEVQAGLEAARDAGEPWDLLVCLRGEGDDIAHAGDLEQAGLEQDPDVLDTWFSSALWPHSTLGWPDPETAAVEPGQPSLGSAPGRPDSLSCYYPGSCLVTGREIISLWVARMVVMGLYNLGDLPFTDCFLHANILDGKGERMSKSKGNGIDPVDIIERYGADAMRYVLCDMQTGTQDIRLPVQAESPFTGELVDLATAKHGRSLYTYICPATGREFDVLGTLPDVPSARVVSDRFEVGRNFCNKLWNAARFALMNLGNPGFRPLQTEDLEPEDRWILSRLRRAIEGVHRGLQAYNPSAAVSTGREFFWSELCDWYLELIKPRLRHEGGDARPARQVLAAVLDQVLRLLHPFVPFITEAVWGHLGRQVPERGVASPLPCHELLALSPWPSGETWTSDPGLEADFERLQRVVRAVRDIRSKYGVAPSARLAATLRATGPEAEALTGLAHHVRALGGLERLTVHPEAQRPGLAATQVVGDWELHVEGVLDPEKERARLQKRRQEIHKGIRSAEGKLGNPAFRERAPGEVVERERQRLEELRRELGLVDENLRGLEEA